MQVVDFKIGCEFCSSMLLLCRGLPLDEKRRLEARIAQLEEELDEEQTNTETAAERARRSMAQAEQLAADLATERANSQKFDGERAQLERQNKDLKAKLTDLERQLNLRSKALIAQLEAKVSSLQEQLDVESR